jgi:hypothetical protein
MKFSLHSLISFFPFLLNHFRLSSFSSLFLSSQAHILAGWPLETRLTLTIFFALFIATRHGQRRKYSLSIVKRACLQRRCIATEVNRLLHAYSFAAGMCLLRRCLAMDVSSDFTIPAFGRHVTILLNIF